MKTKYLFASFLLVILFGCKSSTETVPDASSYFPLKVGTIWYYNTNINDTTSINTTWKVSRVIPFEGKNYFEIIEHNILANYFDTLYYRLEGDKLYLKNIGDEERIVADFNLQLHDTTSWQSDLKVIEKTSQIMTFATPFAPDYGYSITFKKGVGITLEMENGFVVNYKKLLKAELK